MKPKTPFKITCRVRVVGTAKPVGRLRLTIRGVERKPRKTYYRSSVSSFGGNGRHTFRIKGIRKPGQYRPTCAFKAEPNSAFNNSSVSKRLLVRYRNRS